MEEVLLLAVSIILGVGCGFALKHADLVEQAFLNEMSPKNF